MAQRQLIECVPNFSEGRDMEVIKQITDAIEKVPGVRLLDVDPGKATNRTVVTFVGEPEPVIEAAYQALKKASEVIDMSQHSGEHPRMGATDVCPLIPIAGISMDEVVKYAHKLAAKAGADLGIPLYLYENAATSPSRRNLATVRAGEYEGLPEKLKDSKWRPDYGPATFNEQAGATAIGARDFLIAYNVNLNTTSVRRANSVAFDIREKGRLKRSGNKLTGKPLTDKKGTPLRTKGKCKSVKAIGWYIEEYGLAQISMNITNIAHTSLHKAFEECRKSATRRGMRVTGSELVGLVPKKVMIEAGQYFLQQQNRSIGVSEEETIHIAVKSLGLDELGAFDPRKKIIEYLLEDSSTKLANMSLTDFANETAAESPAPGGGSIAAYLGALGVSLGTMVANLSANKRGWDDRVTYYGEWAAKGQQIKDKLLYLVDEDTRAFTKIIEAVRLPMLKAMAREGNPNSVSDAGVGALACRAAVRGAYLNVKINCADYANEKYIAKALLKAEKMLAKAEKEESIVMKIVTKKIG